MPWFEPARDTIRSSPKDDAGGASGEVWDLVAELASLQPSRRRRAVERMQDHSRTDLAPFLLNLLKSIDPGVRRDAAETLGLIGYEMVEEAGKGLAGLLYDAEPEVREEAVVAIWRLGCAGAVPDLQKALCFDAEASVRRVIARKLSAFEGDHSSYFAHALADRDAAVRANAAVGLGLGGHVEFEVRLLRLLEDELSALAAAGELCGLWLLTRDAERLEDFLRMAHDPALLAEICQWLHRYLDRKPESAEDQRDFGRIRTAMRGWPEAADLVDRLSLWHGDIMMRKARAAAGE